MDDIDRRFLDLIHGLEEITDIIFAERAYAQSGVTTLHVCGRMGGRFLHGPGRCGGYPRRSGSGRALQGNPALEEVRENG